MGLDKIVPSTIEATKMIAPEIYKDGLKPAVINIGKSLKTITGVINLALSPLSSIVWGYDKIVEYLIPALEKRLEKINEDKIITPDIMIAGQVLESLKFSGHKKELRDMYTNLLASAMNYDSSTKAHPAFVNIIREISPDEAKLISYLSKYKMYPIINLICYKSDTTYYYHINDFSILGYEANCTYPDLISSYLENLERLNLIKIFYNEPGVSLSYNQLENHPIIESGKRFILDMCLEPSIERGYILFSELGKQFYDICVI